MRHIVAQVFVASLLGIVPSVALAQQLPPTSGQSRQAEARVKAEEGLALFSAQQWNSAYKAFSEADALYSAPTLTLYRARCLRRMSKLLDARALYRKLTGYHVDSGAPESFVKSIQDGEDELASLGARIPVLQIEFPSGVPTGVRVTVEGVLVDASTLDRVEVDPGPHSVVAQADGYVAVLKNVEVVEASTTPVEMKLLRRSPERVLAAPLVTGSVAPAAVVQPSVPTFSVAMFIAAGAGAMTGAFGWGFASKAGTPAASIAPTAVAGAGFGVGVTSLVAGIVFMNLPARNSTPGHARVMFGPGSLLVGGTF